MADEIPKSLVPILERQEAKIELLQHVVVFLCTTVVPPSALSRYIERLTFPVAADTPEATKAMYEAIDRFVDVLEKNRSVLKD